MAKSKAIQAVVWQEDDLFVAKALGIELASQGKSKKEALDNLQEALSLLLEEEKDIKVPVVLPKNPQIKQIYA